MFLKNKENFEPCCRKATARQFRTAKLAIIPSSAAMIRGLTIAVIALAALNGYDRYYNDGYFSDAVVSVLRQIGHSFGF